jgi:large subunit ribosomal protein L10
MLTRAQKEEAVAELKAKFSRANSVIVAEYRGLDVATVDKLRAKLRADGQDGYEYQVVKNSLLRIASEGSDVSVLKPHFKGPTAVAISYADPVRLAKTLVDYAKENEKFALRGGMLSGKAIDTKEIATLATLPSLDALRAQLIGLLQAPARKILGVLQAPGGQLARLASARSKKLEEAGGA